MCHIYGYVYVYIYIYIRRYVNIYMYTYIYPRRTSVRLAVALLRFGRSRPLHISRVSKCEKVGGGSFPARTMLPSLKQSTYPQMTIFLSRTTLPSVIRTPQSYV